MLPSWLRVAASLGVVVGLLGSGRGNWWKAGLLGLTSFLLTGNVKHYWLCLKTLPRDMKALRSKTKYERFLKRMIKDGRTIVDHFSTLVARHPNKPAIVSVDTKEKMTFQEVEEMLLKVANIIHDAGYKHGDSIALIMQNDLPYMPIWLGLSKLGVVSALINYNLRDDSLVHCIKAGHCKAVIYALEFTDAIAAVTEKLGEDMKYYSYGENQPLEGHFDLKLLIERAPTSSPNLLTKPVIGDKTLYIYTSGTTGLPKASIIKGVRVAAMSYLPGVALGIGENDTVYSSLPLYHSNGGIVLAGQMLFHGATLVIRRKFSASRFFEDCYNHGVTVFNYIGETCRYLVATAEGRYDKTHKVRLALGNGLRPSVWKQFTERFNIGQIGEFYGSSEGNANCLNMMNKFGSVGFNSIILPNKLKIRLVKVDSETNEVMRHPDGLAISCGPGEVGEMMGQVGAAGELVPFTGYVSSEATKKKIVHDIWTRGDTAFRSGDLLTQDEEGNFYFQDRTGDTYRWKGENVSTNEVEGIVSRYVGQQDVVSYGVAIPGTDGKAGMICIVDPDENVDLNGLYRELSLALPVYARPVFVRVASIVETTGTFKFVKSKLRKEAFDPSQVGNDKLYYFDAKASGFQAMDQNIFDLIQEGKMRF